MNQIVEHENINVTGGRIWRLKPDDYAYQLLFQTGTIEKISDDFILPLAEYPIFDFIAKERTVLGSETNEVLRQIGIFKYSASGVGEKIKINDKFYYEYLLAVK